MFGEFESHLVSDWISQMMACKARDGPVRAAENVLSQAAINGINAGRAAYAARREEEASKQAIEQVERCIAAERRKRDNEASIKLASELTRKDEESLALQFRAAPGIAPCAARRKEKASNKAIHPVEKFKPAQRRECALTQKEESFRQETWERRLSFLEQNNAQLQSALALALERIDALECAKNDKQDESDIEKEKRRKSESEASLALALRLNDEFNS